ncbi:MAG: sugar phosphate isomerase/epimerase [Clostridia bacterium]|nr:sugar phosphate isomerase/epimerase [Clostridia bacterium]
MKIGTSSYSFSQYIRAGKITQIDTVRLAKEIGFDCIEFTDLTPPEGTTQQEYAKQIKAEADKCGIEISIYAVGADLAQRDEQGIKDETQRLFGCVDIARALGAKLMRHDVMFAYNGYRSFDEIVPTAAKIARDVTEYAEKNGIRTMSENHGMYYQDPDRIEKMIAAVNHPNYGLLMDIGNFMCADIHPAKAVSRLASLAFMVHAKDFVFTPFAPDMEKKGIETRGCNRLEGTSIGCGDVNAHQCFAILKKAGFDGYVDVEYEGSEDCTQGLKKSLKNIKAIFAELD